MFPFCLILVIGHLGSSIPFNRVHLVLIMDLYPFIHPSIRV